MKYLMPTKKTYSGLNNFLKIFIFTNLLMMEFLEILILLLKILFI